MLQVFLLVVLYGLFHGLFFLPVLLSFCGPQPYATADRHYHPNDGTRPATSRDIRMESGSPPSMVSKPVSDWMVCWVSTHYSK